MKADAKGFKFLSMEGKMKIPFFQRTYVWKHENWEELLEELEKDENNFLGAIILKQLPATSGEPKQCEVIDGQQRLTTLSVLLKAICDTLPNEIRKIAENNIMDILFYPKDYTSSVSELRIEHSHFDRYAYRQVIQETPNLESINDKSHLILQCYKYFVEKLNEMDDEEKKSLLNKILKPENKMLVIIDLDEKDDEQAIFDTLNTAGVRLTVAEIIKNAIFKKVVELKDKDYAIELYNETWQKTFFDNEEKEDYWKTIKTTGRIKRENIEILLHCIAVIKGFYDPDKDNLSDLVKLYKKHLADFKDIDALKEFIKEIINYAKVFEENIIIFENTLLSFDDQITRLLHILDKLEISSFHPYIVYLLRNKPKDYLKQLKMLENFVVLNMLTKKESTKHYPRFCKQFIKDSQYLENKLNEIDWESVEKALKNVKNFFATLLLFWIELYRRHKDPAYDVTELKYEYSLEHIMPKNWIKNWGLDKVPHPNPNLTEHEKEIDRDEKISWLGNMTLLKSKLNSALIDNSLEYKINGEGKKKGIKDYATLSISKEIIEEYNKNKIWNEKNIEERTKKLASEIKEIWFDHQSTKRNGFLL